MVRLFGTVVVFLCVITFGLAPEASAASSGNVKVTVQIRRPADTQHSQITSLSALPGAVVLVFFTSTNLAPLIRPELLHAGYGLLLISKPGSGL